MEEWIMSKKTKEILADPYVQEAIEKERIKALKSGSMKSQKLRIHKNLQKLQELQEKYREPVRTLPGDECCGLCGDREAAKYFHMTVILCDECMKGKRMDARQKSMDSNPTVRALQLLDEMSRDPLISPRISRKMKDVKECLIVRKEPLLVNSVPLVTIRNYVELLYAGVPETRILRKMGMGASPKRCNGVTNRMFTNEKQGFS